MFSDEKKGIKGQLIDLAQALWEAARLAHREQPTMETELRSMGKRMDQLVEKLRKGAQ